MNHSFLPLCALLLSLVACSTSGPQTVQTPTSLFSRVPSPAPSPGLITLEPGATLAASASPSAQPVFTVAVIADTSTQKVSRDQAQNVIREASSYLREFSPIEIVMVDFTEDGNGGSMADLANRYMVSRAQDLPDGLVIASFGDQEQARKDGGYGFSLLAPGNFKNPFISPVVGSSRIYVAVVDYSYKYMPCGYGGADTASSPASLPGECRGQMGLACVQNNGYSMCSNAVGNLYTSTPTHAAASMVVHGLLHNFGPNGDKDDYATPECNARMGYPAGFFDLQESEYYNGLCPFVYEELTKAYKP